MSSESCIVFDVKVKSSLLIQVVLTGDAVLAELFKPALSRWAALTLDGTVGGIKSATGQRANGE